MPGRTPQSNEPAHAIPKIDSFIIRFIETRRRVGRRPAPGDWRGVIVHVQTNKEKGFTDFADAIAFMGRYVSIGDFSLKGGEHAESEIKRH